MAGVLDTTLCDRIYQLLDTGRWFSYGILVFSTNKNDRHNIAQNIVESGVKHHNPNPNPPFSMFVRINQIEDEQHFLIHCTKFANVRKLLLKKLNIYLQDLCPSEYMKT